GLGALGFRNIAKPSEGAARIREGKHDMDGRVFALFVLEFRFGERGAVGEAPAHRLEILEDEALLVELAESPRDLRLVSKRHRGVGSCPETANAETLELALLDLDELLGVLAARAADRHGIHFALLRAQLLVHLLLDRKAVAVPAGNVRSVEAQHRVAAN